MDRSISAPQKVANTTSEWVWFDGATALLQGQGVCYEYDYNAPATPAGAAAETAASADARRTNRVVLPNAANGKWFAGVVSADHPASPTGQLVEIYCPGSTCFVLTKANLTLGAGVITCQAGGALAGYFTKAGFEGQGSAVPLQTLDTSTTAGKTLCRLQEGLQSGLIEVLDPADASGGTGTAGGARQSKVGGVTYYATATNGAALTTTLANGTRIGERKAIVIAGTQTTTGVVVTVTAGKKIDQTTGITTITGNTSGRQFVAEWCGAFWMTRYDDFDTIA